MSLDTPLPKFYQVKRSLTGMAPLNVVDAVQAEWKRLNLDRAIAKDSQGQHPTGKRIAIGVGSRGLHDLAVMVQSLVQCVKSAGGLPFIVPAMGSHGGATVAGQVEVLAALGITEAAMGCPLEATMETVLVGTTSGGLPAYFDANAAKADGIIIINRVKMHTSFHGDLESGLHKMLAIGLGKEKAATLLHSRGPDGLRDDMPEVARLLLTKVPFLAGFGIVEDGYHRAVALEAFGSVELAKGEQALLKLAKSLAPSLPFPNVDVLVVDKMGKDISGTGMDTNVIGRLKIPGLLEPVIPKVKAIVVLDLTEATHGNALGMGLADFTTKQLADKVDFHLTGKNVLASGFLERGRLPIVLGNALEALDAALNHVFRQNPQDRASARILQIGSTLKLEEFRVSENLIEEVRNLPGYLEDSGPNSF